MAAPVKYYSSAMNGAPSVTGQVGTLLNVLDACLVNGFGQQNATSLSVTSNEATLVLPSTPPFIVNGAIQIQGAVPSALNDTWVVTSVVGNTVKFKTTGVSDGAASGTITAKVPGSGWDRPFSGTNVGVYRSSDVESVRHYLRVDDSVGMYANVRGFETMSDATNGTFPYPAVGSAATGGRWAKSGTADATTRPWIIVATSKSFYYYVASSLATHGFCMFFGDIIPYRTADQYRSCLNSFPPTANPSLMNSIMWSCMGAGNLSVPSSSNTDITFSRNTWGAGAAPVCSKTSALQTADGYSGTATYNSRALPYPNPAEGGLHLAPIVIVNTGPYLRGEYPGAFHSGQVAAGNFTTGDIIPGTGKLAGKTLLVVRAGPPALTYSAANTGMVVFDLTGPWY